METPLSERRSYRIKDVIELTGLSRSKVFNLIRDGHLKTVRSVGCTLILKDDLDAFFDGLKAAA
jgi:excisionase family DNA binding protein